MVVILSLSRVKLTQSANKIIRNAETKEIRFCISYYYLRLLIKNKKNIVLFAKICYNNYVCIQKTGKDELNMPQNSIAIEIKNLTKFYGSNKALDDVSFSVKKGEIMGFLGPNGAGKSTTMNIICGCISPSSGSVAVGGFDVLENPKNVKKKIGYLPENPPLYLDMTVSEYLNFVYELKKVTFDRESHLQKVMERVQIYDKKDRLIKNLSKGYKQRVGLAQALIGDPEVLILDEPTVGLDPRQIIEIRNVIKSLRKDKTIIFSTHIMQEIEAVCDSVTIISNGKIVAQGSLDEINQEAGDKDKFIVGIIGNGQIAYEVIKSIPEVKQCDVSKQDKNISEFIIKQMPGTDIRISLTKELSKNDLAIASLRSASLTLEEIFIKLTNADFANIDDKEVKADDSDI